MIAIVSGSTGLVGRQLVQKLLDDPTFSQVLSVSRRSLDMKHGKLKEILIKDFSELSKYQEQLRGDVYFCCLGTTLKSAGSQENFRKVDFDAVLEFAKVAKRMGAQKFIVISAMGAHPQSRVFYNRVKGETEKALQELNLKCLVIFRPGLLMGPRQEFRAAEALFMKIAGVSSHFIPFNLMKKFTTKSEVLAEHMLSVAKGASPKFMIIEAEQIGSSPLKDEGSIKANKNK